MKASRKTFCNKMFLIFGKKAVALCDNQLTYDITMLLLP